MKIAIAVEQKTVSAHFGKCPEFLIADIKGGKLIQSETLLIPKHSPGSVPELLHSKKIQRILCGGMGTTAAAFFHTYGIQVITGVTGDVNQALNAFMNGTLLANGPSFCTPGSKGC
ncbi:dinitrogenase iron-molybdenum cofactor [Anaerotignum neopropionicum]|uniref:Dinitrogenase iron-molybdenum cofactor n=1 Tax=Anaerotignum neopropionicum TaxID=36847 RepID=A0A136WC45_9FIRM|nr:NifB/NifX family molybdenum-iron cluster-binding protein [Anaerotignum neopropionicum]KXL52095.1 dinitrogenase iron-molybdenum cofactor [Anaerotignum neopropionicum]